MREILFRGKRVDNGEWVEGDFCHPSNICKESIGYDEQLKQSGIPIWEDYNIRTETVGQYTGLTDKNGKKIFEGDIIKDRFDDIGQIEYKPKYAAFIIQGWETGFAFWVKKDIEVIGNIHDNPELLK